MFLFEETIKNTQNLIVRQRVIISCLQELFNIRDSVLYSELLPKLKSVISSMKFVLKMFFIYYFLLFHKYYY